MKTKLKYLALWLVFISLFMFCSCGDDFLDVADPTVLSEDIFPQTVDDLDPILIDIFGRLQETEYGTMMRFWPLLSHCRDHGYNGAQYNEFALNELNPNLSNVRNVCGNDPIWQSVRSIPFLQRRRKSEMEEDYLRHKLTSLTRQKDRHCLYVRILISI